MVLKVGHSCFLIASFLRVIFIHNEIMIRYAQSHSCVLTRTTRLRERFHNHRQYSLHPSLTNRYRSFSGLLHLLDESFMLLSLWHMHYTLHPLQSSWPFDNSQESIILREYKTPLTSILSSIHPKTLQKLFSLPT